MKMKKCVAAGTVVVVLVGSVAEGLVVSSLSGSFARRRVMMRGDSPEELAESAEKWLLQAEKLRLEATRDELLLQKEKALYEQEKRLEEEMVATKIEKPATSSSWSVSLVDEFSWDACGTLLHALPHAPQTMTEEIAREITANVSSVLPSSARKAQWCHGGVVFRGSFRGDEVLEACDSAVDGYRFFWVQDDLEADEFESWLERFKFSQETLVLGELWEGLAAYAPIKPPALVAVDASIEAPWQPLNRPARILSFLGSLLTVLLYSTGAGVLNDRLIADPDLLASRAIAPVSAALLGIELVHQASHLVVAKNRGVEWSTPGVPLPSLPTGLLGVVNRVKQHPRTRQDMFDTALVGPCAGLIASLFCLGLGAALGGATASSSELLAQEMPQLPADLIRGSVLASLFYAAANDAAIPPHTLVSADPLFVAGLAGIISNACQTLPLGQTDGGRATTASLGKLLGGAIIDVFKYSVSIVALITGNSLVMLYVFYVVSLQNSEEISCQDDVTAPSSSSRKAHAACLAIAFFALIPLPGDLLCGNQQQMQQQQSISMGTESFASRQPFATSTTSAAANSAETTFATSPTPPGSSGSSLLPAGFPEIM